MTAAQSPCHKNGSPSLHSVSQTEPSKIDGRLTFAGQRSQIDGASAGLLGADGVPINEGHIVDWRNMGVGYIQMVGTDIVLVAGFFDQNIPSTEGSKHILTDRTRDHSENGCAVQLSPLGQRRREM